MLSPVTPILLGKATLLWHSQSKSYQVKFTLIIFKMPSNTDIL